MNEGGISRMMESDESMEVTARKQVLGKFCLGRVEGEMTVG